MKAILWAFALLAPSVAMGQSGNWFACAGGNTCTTNGSTVTLDGNVFISGGGWSDGGDGSVYTIRAIETPALAQKSPEPAPPAIDLGHGTREPDRVGLGIKP